MKAFNENKAVVSLSEIIALECGIHPAVERQIRIVAALHNVMLATMQDIQNHDCVKVIFDGR